MRRTTYIIIITETIIIATDGRDVAYCERDKSIKREIILSHYIITIIMTDGGWVSETRYCEMVINSRVCARGRKKKGYKN